MIDPPASDGAAVPLRLRTLDAVRGVAVMGILLLNIIDFAMPGYAEIDPSFYGGSITAARTRRSGCPPERYG